MTDITLTPQGRFNYAVNVILDHEGGYCNDVDDPGGETNFGITQETLTEYYKVLNLPSDVKLLSVEDAKIYYKAQYWDKYNYNAINSLPIAVKIFDMAVNMGAHEAHTLVQRALSYCGDDVIVDGILGGKTLSAINDVCLHGKQADLKSELINESEEYYDHLIEVKPFLKCFLKGWMKRAED